MANNKKKMFQKKKKNKQVKKFSNLEEPLFLLVNNGEELPYSTNACSDDNDLEIDGLKHDNQLIEIRVPNRSGGNPLGEEISSNVREKERLLEDKTSLITALGVV